jgi:hypothetical protein
MGSELLFCGLTLFDAVRNVLLLALSLALQWAQYLDEFADAATAALEGTKRLRLPRFDGQG